MCPVVTAVVGVVSAVASAGSALYGSHRQREIAERYARDAQNAATANALVDAVMTQLEIERTEYAAEQAKKQLRRTAEQVRGAGLVGYAAGGVDVSTGGGSVEQWNVDTESALQEDLATVGYNLEQDIYNLRTAAFIRAMAGGDAATQVAARVNYAGRASRLQDVGVGLSALGRLATYGAQVYNARVPATRPASSPYVDPRAAGYV